MLRLYVDENVDGAIVRGLRRRGIDLLTVQEDGRRGIPDRNVLQRASELRRVVFSQDDDLLAEAAACWRAGTPFCGVIYAHQRHVSVGECVRDLELLATLTDSADLENRVEYLPLRRVTTSTEQ